MPMPSNNTRIPENPYTWDNQVEINFGVSSYSNVQLLFRDTLGTTGESLSDIRDSQHSGGWNEFEMEWIVLP